MKKERAEAKILAYENAASFIESHGEEGGMDQNDYDVSLDLYCSEKDKLALRLLIEADKIRSKYNLYPVCTQ